MLGRLPPIIDHRQAGLFAPTFNLFGRQPVVLRRPAGAGALRMEFADHHWRARVNAARDVAQDAGRIVGVVQDHRDQGPIRRHAGGLDRGCVADDALDLGDAALVLQAFQIGQRVGGAVERVDDALLPTRLASAKLT